jgi:hypothetical protein
VKPDALRPYLAVAGIESLLRDGKLQGELHAAVRASETNGITASARLAALQFSDGDQLFAMPDVNIVGATIDPSSGESSSQASNWWAPRWT